MNLEATIQQHASTLENWMPARQASERFPQFSYAQLKNLFWRRDEHLGLSRCYKQIGKKGYVNIPLFGMWMAGEMPEQKEKKFV